MEPGERLGHYTIVSHLGSGGMGAVYRATDTTLGRDVALKILPGDMAADPDRLERFRREARAVAALNHPHIVTIHTVEQAGGVHFLTMELVTGQALDKMMAAASLPIDRVVEIASAIAGALAAAHEKGIVHRDLKPANVIASDSGPVKVLDFGLAKVEQMASMPDADTATNLGTEIGVVLGTPAYMSPEQVSGISVDHRTDIFSLGVLLYELATGVRPFHGRSTVELASSILRDAPRDASDIRSSVPSDLARVITRCLEKAPAARYASMADVHQALRAIAPPARSPVAEGPSVAVLPFQNLSADPSNEFFGDGLAEEILNALTQIDGLRVAARASSFSFKGASTDIAEIGAKLRVSTVLNGSVRRAGNRVRVAVELVDAANGFRIWSERYDREMADIFDVQDEIARAIADKLKVALTGGGSARLVKGSTSNVEAYELFLKGRALLLKRGRHVSEGVECLRRALDLDPNFAAAWAWMSDASSVRGYWGMAPPGETMPKALTAARRAVALDPELADGHTALAMALLLWERDYVGAEASFKRALALNPADTQGRAWYGLFLQLWALGRVEGVEEIERALQADPLSAYVDGVLGMAYGCVGRTADAVQSARRAVERAPDSLLSHWTLGLAAHWHRSFDESIAAFKKAKEISDSHVYTVTNLIVCYADAGRMTDAQAEWKGLNAWTVRGYLPSSAKAIASAALGMQDEAIELMHQGCDEREPTLLIYSTKFPDAKRLHDDPRFSEVRRRMGLLR
jgi:serine/threonine protein kinase/Tfp pilus assembly protein PilF